MSEKRMEEEIICNRWKDLADEPTFGPGLSWVHQPWSFLAFGNSGYPGAVLPGTQNAQNSILTFGGAFSCPQGKTRGPRYTRLPLATATSLLFILSWRCVDNP